MKVYPRECGATAVVATVMDRTTGLSPRVRGNPQPLLALNVTDRSIPASAGQPGSPSPINPESEVYPRECGATVAQAARPCFPTGLSPRVRGNRFRQTEGLTPGGSIPASAGQPLVGVHHGLHLRVYPRECGATRLGAAAAVASGGLSPRVRGNPARRGWNNKFRWSIPASAGQPSIVHRLPLQSGVYPRECGATRNCRNLGRSNLGLSPRVRGNRESTGQELNVLGSIPASAGQPYY